MAARGSSLVYRRGSLVATVLALVRDSGAGAVTWSAVYDAAGIAAGRELQSALEEAGVRASMVHDAPAVAPDDTAAARSTDGGRGYRAFAPYAATWSAQPRAVIRAQVRLAAHGLPAEALPVAQDFASRPLAAEDAPSEKRAAAVLAAYVAGPALQYSTARNVPASEPTSRLSAALSFGTIAARTVLAAIDERSADPFLLTEERMSLRTLARALVLRDFFLQLGWFFEDRPDDVLQPRMRRFPFTTAHPALAAWRAGETGFPFVDAGIRQLHATGWMHPRARLVAASFLCFDLGVDWRIGRDIWDDQLVEDDPALASGNWQWVAGVGADLAQFPRIYNPRRQARAFDPLGTYARRWISELAGVPVRDFLDTPPARPSPQLSLPLFGTSRYPAPVVEHEAAARHFLQRYADFFDTVKR